jgi:hypothetical protein
MIQFLSMIIFILIAAPTAFAATPEILEVSGTANTGQILTISGTAMIDSNTTNWDFSESAGSFEGASASADGWKASSVAYDSTVKLMGNNSLRSTITGSGAGNCPTSNAFGGTVYRTMSRYGRMYVLFGTGFGNLWKNAYYQKMIEYVTPTGVYVQPGTGSSTVSKILTNANGRQVDMNLPVAWTTGRWYCVEWFVDMGALTVWVDGTQIGTNNITINYGAPYPQLGIVNACPVNGTYNMYIDEVMSSSSRVYPATMVEIGNKATYSSATKVKQPLSSISDTSIAITADLTGLGAGPYYLWVTNNRQERSSGYELIGGGDGGEAPTAPAGLRVTN